MPRRYVKPRPVKQNCVFCHEGRVPDYKNFDELRTYITERGKIVGRDRSGICAKHQRQLALQIKRARHLAYLPFVSGV